MSKICYSAEGNAEIWDVCPENYVTEEEWNIKVATEEKIAHDEAERVRLLPENLKIELQKRIDLDFSTAVKKYLRAYPDEETTLLFEKQVIEMLAYKNTGDVSEFLRNLADTRMISIDELVNKIEICKKQYDKVMSTLLGLRYYYMDVLSSLTTTEQLLDLDISYKLTVEDM